MPVAIPKWNAEAVANRHPRHGAAWWLVIAATGTALAGEVQGSEPAPSPRFQQVVGPILQEYCYECHGDGMDKGKVAFDAFGSHAERVARKDLWLAVLKNTRAGLMPPEKKPQLSAAQRQALADWIQSEVFEVDPQDPDPGRVTVRRLNRVEYRNTIRELMGIEFNAEAEFPPDDTGHGFDNIGDVLTLSPMLMEKYLDAAKAIVSRAVPVVGKVPAEHPIPGCAFRAGGEEEGKGRGAGPLALSYYEKAVVTNRFSAAQAGKYQLVVALAATERYVDGQFDLNKCRLVFRVDGRELLKREFVREGGRQFRFEYDQEWQPGEHELVLEVEPLTPDVKQVRSLSLRIDNVTVRGPMEDPKYWVRPNNYARFFGEGPPEDAAARRAYTGELLSRFATRAFRRPVDAGTVGRLVELAERVGGQPGMAFEAAVGQAMVAVLASPRFLFREEEAEPIRPGQAHPFVDEYALASRLSYFLWSSMPDEALFRLAGANRLRAELGAQVNRMLDDPRSEALMRDFPGQWLQGRDIDSVQIDARAVMNRESTPDPEVEEARRRFRELRDKPPESLTQEEKDALAKARESFRRSFGRFNRFELNGDLRRAMRQELEKYFEHVVRENRSLLELIDSDYTFLNQRLAEHYGITGVEGDSFRKVSLPAESPRGGVLTMGSVLAVTSNPNRTSPVKRGVFLLDNVLGMPPPPPPPNIPALEDAAKDAGGREPSLRETLALHRAQPLCSSCHNRMDPLGLAFENFNALGRWREKERDHPIDAAGRLITGENFTTVQELKRILVRDRRDDFYRCLTEKMLTYALGRGLEYQDEVTVDRIVERIIREEGRPSALLLGIVESAPFQKTRNPDAPRSTPGGRLQQSAELRIQP